MLHEFEAGLAFRIPREFLFAVVAEAIEHVPVLLVSFAFPLWRLHIVEVCLNRLRNGTGSFS
jgi:hypothetical protein